MKINAYAEAKVLTALNEIEAGCKARLLPYATIMKAIETATAQLDNLFIAKKHWPGCIIQIEPPKVANSYKSYAEGTAATLEYFSSGWFVTAIWRKPVNSTSYGSSHTAKLELTETAKDNIPDKFKLWVY